MSCTAPARMPRVTPSHSHSQGQHRREEEHSACLSERHDDPKPAKGKRRGATEKEEGRSDRQGRREEENKRATERERGRQRERERERKRGRVMREEVMTKKEGGEVQEVLKAVEPVLLPALPSRSAS